VTHPARLQNDRPMPLNADRAPDVLYDVGAPLGLRHYLIALWRRRDFILMVPLGRLRAQTQSTVLGGLWHLLNPLLFAAVYYFVFGIIFRGRDDIPNYAAFLVAGLFTFFFTQRVASTGARAITGNASLMGQVNFPRAALPLSATIAESISHGWSLVALFVVVLLTGEPLAVTWLLIVPILLLQCAFNLGLAMIIARLAFHFRDVQQFLPYVIRMWLYLSGIFYTLEFVEQRLSSSKWLVTLFELNPAYAFAALTRAAVLSDYKVGGFEVVVATAWAIGLVIGGFLFFRAREVEYADG
jgi:teichoic acid transport system permease protein